MADEHLAIDLDEDDLVHVAGPPIGRTVPLPGGRHTDVHVAGPEDGEVVLLVPGLGDHRTEWPPELLATLHDAGYRTATADNRDCGRASVIDAPLADLPRDEDGWIAPYDLADLADDHVAVLDHLGVERAHVLGQSMGGMIAQRIAIHHSHRVVTLTSVMSTTGARGVGGVHPEARHVLKRLVPAHSLDAFLAHELAYAHTIGTAGHVDEVRHTARARVEYARGVHPEGTARQLLAIRRDGDRTPALRSLQVPTLVLHGAADPLIDVSGGHATAAAIPGAELEIVPGWGHDLPVPLLDRLLDRVLDHLGREAAPARAS